MTSAPANLQREREWVSSGWNCVYTVSKIMKLVETCIGDYRVSFHKIAPNHISQLNAMAGLWNLEMKLCIGDPVSFVNSNVGMVFYEIVQ